MKLSDQKLGQRVQIVRVESDQIDFVRRLEEFGFLPGTPCEIIHEAPFGKDPIAIRIRGMTVSLRREEAKFIEVENV
ncbi:MAG: hypothetical protein CL678_13070 [Bdellovibrionaceae bacterium]|nr:hypothetical protein [Pseudobdellovibrionaceae bacterium]|tara:strand:+ start:3647 stop:3877 length:231 start_codon:yes stop_codon:yes gene_type:complete